MPQRWTSMVVRLVPIQVGAGTFLPDYGACILLQACRRTKIKCECVFVSRAFSTCQAMSFYCAPVNKIVNFVNVVQYTEYSPQGISNL